MMHVDGQTSLDVLTDNDDLYTEASIWAAETGWDGFDPTDPEHLDAYLARMAQLTKRILRDT